MTLEELQEEFPHGSRWKVRQDGPGAPIASNGHSVYELMVIGWHTDTGSPCVVGGHGARYLESGLWDRSVWRTRMERVPDPVPCPITEPTMLTRPGSYWTSQPIRQGRQFITLHPAEPGATEGRYTWDGA